MSNILTRFINAFNPATYTANPMEVQKQFTKNLNGYIAPVQLQRLRHDIQMWREAVTEAENAWYPQRVRMQRMYIDTILSGHTLACVQKRKDLTLMRDWTFTDPTGAEHDDLKKLFNKQWFANFIEYALEARFFGYSLDQLDAYRYIFLIKNIGFAGSYFNGSHTAISATSDYAYIENNRTIDKAIRGVYSSLLPALGAPIVLNSDGTLTDESISYFTSLAELNLREMARNTELSAFEVLINSTQNVLSTNTLIVAVELVPIGVARAITVNIGFVVALS